MDSRTGRNMASSEDNCLRQQVLDAFGLKLYDITATAPMPSRVRLWRAVTFAAWRGKVISRRSLRRLEQAEAGYRVREEAYLAALPGRMREIGDMLSAGLPDGMRFEWAAEGDGDG